MSQVNERGKFALADISPLANVSSISIKDKDFHLKSQRLNCGVQNYHVDSRQTVEDN